MDYDTLASADSVQKTISALGARHIEAFYVESGSEALSKIKELIPAGASVMNGASVTLEQIGFVEHLKGGEHGWRNLHAEILAEKDPTKASELRRQAVLSEYYLGSVHGLAETGEFIVASNTGSQLPHVVFTSPNIIFVVSTKKITPSLPEAYQRLMQHVIPLEDKHMKEIYGPNSGTAPNKILTFTGENPMLQRKVKMILVGENLGF